MRRRGSVRAPRKRRPICFLGRFEGPPHRSLSPERGRLSCRRQTLVRQGRAICARACLHRAGRRCTSESSRRWRTRNRGTPAPSGVRSLGCCDRGSFHTRARPPATRSRKAPLRKDSIGNCASCQDAPSLIFTMAASRSGEARSENSVKIDAHAREIADASTPHATPLLNPDSHCLRRIHPPARCRPP